ncbi:uncharacterized protein LOC129956840 [Argiope bruennichi]|uniref:uncharacterized protein LOC129956840 n=1 Tax=Argiope bruennichi TaxID=94029 RepID=UPI0024953644|nr:uncharacterized protein LOC129956840 [Argiope bruennichi]
MTSEHKDVSLTTNPSTNDDSSPVVARVSFKAPPFWKQNPKLYFVQIESQFTIAGITKDETKYHHVVAAIETDVIAQVSDIILNLNEELMYEALKERLIEQFADSETHLLKLLLQELQLGDDRPSEDLLKNLWLQRLPTAVQQFLAVSTGDLDALAKMADQVLEVTDSSSIHLFEGPNSGCKDCHTLRSHSSSRRFNPSDGICWFHHKFGSTARNCKTPCNYNQEH